MRFKILGLALCLATTFTALTASAQKAYTEGTISYTGTAGGQNVDGKLYFKGDSSSTSGKAGPATFRTIFAHDGDYVVSVVDIPLMSMKKAFIATPAELEQGKDMEPQFTFTATTDTKVINGFNCKKFNVKDDKGGAYEAWVTNDFKAPYNLLTRYFAPTGGFPIQFTTFQMGKPLAIVVKSISDEKPPVGVFSIPADYERGNFTDMINMMRGGGR